MSVLHRRIARAVTVALFAVSCGGDHPSPSGPQGKPAPGRPTALTILFGASAKALAGDTLRVPVLVTDSVGRPVPDVMVYFETDVNKPGYSFPTVSDSLGIANGFVRVPTGAGDYTAEAAVMQTLPNGQQTIVTKRFVVYVRGGESVRLIHGTPGTLAAQQGGTVTTPEYTVYDRFGNFATAGQVTFSSLPQGSVPSITQAPDSFGRVKSMPWTLGASIGTYRLIATTGASADTLTALVVSGPPMRIDPDSTPLVAAAGQAPVRIPAVIVRDAEGRGVPSVDVTWSDSTGVLAGCTSKTSIKGVAPIGCTWRPGSADGMYRLTATAGTLSTAIAVKVIAKPATLEIISGPESGSTVRAGSSFDVTLRLLFADGTPATGYSINQSTLTTDASGIAHYRWVPLPFVWPLRLTFTVDLFPTLTRTIALRTIGEPHYVGISAGGSHTCASSGEGYVNYSDFPILCWGSNAQGQLGDGTITTRTVPTAATVIPAPNRDRGASGYFNVAAGDTHTCVGRVSYPGSEYDSGSPYSLLCWGGNSAGQSGAPPSPSGGATEMGTTLTAPAAGTTHSCAAPTGYTMSGRYRYYITTGVQCWGDNTFGQLGDGTTTAHIRPVDVASPALARVSRLTAGDGFTCALNTASEAYCWGKNSDGQLGDGTTTDRTTPVLVAGGLHFGTISAGKAHVCATVNPGSIYCWGRNDAGQLGDGTRVSRATPTLVASPQSLSGVTAGGAHTCAIASGGAALCWGDNRFGQLGNGTTVSSVQPVAVSGGLSFGLIAAGRSHTCAVPANQAVGAFCWGLNAEGQLGDGTTTNRSTPTRVADYLSAAPTPATARSASARSPH